MHEKDPAHMETVIGQANSIREEYKGPVIVVGKAGAEGKAAELGDVSDAWERFKREKDRQVRDEAAAGVKAELASQGEKLREILGQAADPNGPLAAGPGLDADLVRNSQSVRDELRALGSHEKYGPDSDIGESPSKRSIVFTPEQQEELASLHSAEVWRERKAKAREYFRRAKGFLGF